ncbi:MAG: spermidine/putrescine ABC transporter ATP-binding protein [Acidobacteriota bacterium]
MTGGRPDAPLFVDRLAKRFGAEAVLDDVTFEAAPGEILALLGPSGSGKTTLLRLLAGFERPDAGEIRLGAERIDRLPAERRGFGMVFQHYALFPHRTVAGNVAFGLETRKLPRAEIADRVESALARVELAGLGRRKVGEISGGQQQRVALARALAPEPRVLLLDEPLSNLDPSLRERTRRDLARTLGELGITTLLVTHEQEEAFELGGRVALLHRGRLAQIGTPDELYRRPATLFAAGFVGRASFVPVTVRALDGDAATVDGAALPGGPLRVENVESVAVGEPGVAMLRPESLALAAPDSAGAIAGSVIAARFGGARSWVVVRVDGTGAAPVELEVEVTGARPRPGERVGVVAAPGGAPARLYRPESA